MNNKALTLSLFFSFVAIYFVYSYVNSIEDDAKKKYGTSVLVVKASKDIKEQETINDTMFKLELIPKRFLEPAAVSFEEINKNDEKPRDLKYLVGTVAIVPIRAGEQITLNKITEPNVRTGLAPQITPGRRAVSIPVTEMTGVSKLVKPGDRVDLIGVLDRGGGKENRIVKTLLQDVVILSVGKNVSNNIARIVEQDPFGGKEKIKPLTEDITFTSVTVEVEPPQAQVLALILAGGENTIIISLRNNDDTERVGMGTMGLEDVLGGEYSRNPRGPASRK